MSRRAVLTSVFVLALLLAGDKLLLGPYGLVRLDDVFDSTMVEYERLGSLLYGHGLFAWYPHFAGGRPSHAFHFTPLHPLALAAAVVPLWLLYAGLRLLLIVGAGYGMFRFGRDYLGFEPRLALVAGLVFALTSQTQTGSQVHALFNFVFPLVFVWSLGLGPEGRRGWLVRGLGLAGLALLSYPVFTIYYYPLVQVLLLLFVNPLHGPSTRRFLSRTVLFWLGYGLIALPLIYALLGFGPESQRTFYVRTEPFLARLLEFALELPAASLLVSLLGGALALAAHAPLVRRLAAVSGALLLLAAFFTSSASTPLRERLLGNLDPHRLFWVENFLLTVLALVGLRVVLARPELLRLYLAGAAVALVVTGRYLWSSPGGVLLVLNLLVPAGIALHLAPAPAAGGAGRRRRWALAAVATALVLGVRIDVYHRGQENVPYRRLFAARPSVAEALAGPDVGRVVTLGSWPALSDHLGVETADVFSAAFTRRYRAVWRVAVDGQLESDADRRLFEWKFYELNPLNGALLRRFTREVYGASPPHPIGRRAPYCPPVFEESLRWRLPVFLAADVGAVVSLRPVRELEALAERTLAAGECPEPADESGPLWRVRRFFKPVPVWVYRLGERPGRAYLVDRAEVLASDTAVLEALGRRTIAEVRASVLLNARDPGVEPAPATPAPGGAGGAGQVTVRERRPDRLVLEVTSARPAYLVVANNYSRRWEASVDDRPVPVLPANHAFQAVRIGETGRHRVVLEYRDPRLWLCYAGIPLGFGLLALGARSREGLDTEGRNA